MCFPCVTHWLHQQLNKSLEQTVYRFNFPCLPICFNLLPSAEGKPWLLGPETRDSKKLVEKKNKGFSFSWKMWVQHLEDVSATPKQGWFHVATTTCCTAPALTKSHWPCGTYQWEAHCPQKLVANTAMKRGGVTTSTLGKRMNPAAMLRASWDLCSWGSALGSGSRVQVGPPLAILLQFAHKHRALILRHHVGDCVTNAIWGILLKKPTSDQVTF